MNFASLHVHDQYSLLDGAGSAEEYFARAKDLGIVAIAQTNHGTLRGWRHWQRAAKGTDIKPILSLEGYFSVTDRFDKRAKNKREDGTNVYNHLIIHAKNETGQKNLMRLNEEAWSTEAYYHKPRFDRELLQRYSEGLIVTSACMSGPIAGALLDGNEEQAYRRAEWFREIFGEDFYIEVMSEKDRKSTRLNSSHVKISYAVFCLKKKNNWLTFFSEYQE